MSHARDELDDLAASIKGRDDADALTPEELELLKLAREDAEHALEALRQMEAMILAMRSAATVGQVRGILARIETIDETLEGL